MVALNEARGIIYGAFVAGIGATEFILDNEKWEDGPPENAAWYRCVVRHTDRQQESLGPTGGRKFESGGQVIIQCFAPLDSGAEAADTLAETARGIFEGKTLSLVRFTSAEVVEIGATDDWYQINVNAFFTYTETK